MSLLIRGQRAPRTWCLTASEGQIAGELFSTLRGFAPRAMSKLSKETQGPGTKPLDGVTANGSLAQPTEVKAE